MLRRPHLHLTWMLATLLGLSGNSAAQSNDQPAPADLRAMLEGTWQLDEWHVNGQILRPPQIDGRWSNHDGVVLVIYTRRDTNQTMAGYGTYQMTANSWSYGYIRTQNSTAPPGGTPTVTVNEPNGAMQSFKILREPGKVILEGAAGDRREYDNTFFTFTQKGQIIRKWRKIAP